MTAPSQDMERRRDRRYPFRVRLALSAGRQEIVAQTEDVSFTGIFVRTDTPLPERHLVQLRLTLPPQGDVLTVMGMVARSFRSHGGRAPGAGVQFYALTTEQRLRWNGFVRSVAAGMKDEAARSADPPPISASLVSGSPDPVRRRHPRYAAALQVHLQTVDDLHRLFTRNVSKGGLFVGTELEVPAGTRLKVNVIHPKTGDLFALEAVVRWCSTASDPGLGLEFVSLSEQRRDEFYDFISSELPVEEVVYVAGGDPGFDQPARQRDRCERRSEAATQPDESAATAPAPDRREVSEERAVGGRAGSIQG